MGKIHIATIAHLFAGISKKHYNVENIIKKS
jgi:hypothetical protein